MSDHFDYWDEGVDEEVEEYLEQARLERQQQDAQFQRAVKAEVKRQLAAMNLAPSKPQANIKQHNQTKPTPVSKGKTKTVNCACCKLPFEARIADLNRGWAKFCSKRCKAVKQEARTGQFRKYLERQLS